MAFDEKKYLDFTGLQAYDGKIKTYIGTELAAGDAKALQDAKDYADGLAENYDAAGSAASVQAKLDEEVARAKAAEEAAKTQADKGVEDAATAQAAAEGAQAAAEAADAKAQGAQDDVDALAGKVGEVPEGSTVMGIITNIQESAYDDTEIRGLIGDNADAIAAEKERAEGVEATLQGNIDAVGAKVTTLVGEDADKSVRTIANEELAKQLIAEGAAESLDTLQEIAAWIQAHPNDASAMSKAIDDLEALVGTLPEGVTATTIVGYIQEAVAAEKTRAEGVEAELAADIAALEAKFGEGEGTVSDMIADAVKVETDARVAADEAIDARVVALEAIDHSHANQAELDLIASGDKAKWDAAAAQAHTHANAEELAKIAEGDKAKWDAALQAADITTGTANGAIAVKGVDVAVKGLGSAAYTEASAYDAAGAADGALTSAKAYTDQEVAALNDSFVAITTTEINALFPTA